MLQMKRERERYDMGFYIFITLSVIHSNGLHSV